MVFTSNVSVLKGCAVISHNKLGFYSHLCFSIQDKMPSRVEVVLQVFPFSFCDKLLSNPLGCSIWLPIGPHNVIFKRSTMLGTLY
ncbi:unnamed protein product [Camellia sinensis]